MSGEHPLHAFVLDCSVTMAWFFDDETSAYSDKVFDALHTHSALVPSLWPYEVVSSLVVAERRKRLQPQKVILFNQLLDNLPIALDDAGPYLAFSAVMDIARSYRLTPYDAAYAELALRKGLPLATLDQALKKAAKKLDIPIYS